MPPTQTRKANESARRRCSAVVLSRRHRAASQSHFQRWLPAWFSWPFWSATAAPCSSAPAPRGTPWRKTPWHAVPRLSKWIYPRSYATTPWRPSWYHQLPVLLWGCWSLLRFLPPLWFGGRRLSSKKNQVLKSFWCALTPAPRCVRLTRAPHASAELVRTPLAHARPPVASREPQRPSAAYSPSWSPPFALLRHNHVPVTLSIHSVSPPHPAPPSVACPGQAEHDEIQARIWWLSFIAGCIIVLPFCNEQGLWAVIVL